uniref:Major facilitator superfamily (MFS) profile domain-containing protein n=1 Tax=Ditylum brightwellii TaxID=49249 RepID=A0A7S4T0W9_9STRA|mmetsp:Transcript_5988/g.7923  ORF Transcript_5988/g.7923 Transcript_5988/m.7923 type:complete len:547 (+) Transcript_5988:69-1709(+)
MKLLTSRNAFFLMLVVSCVTLVATSAKREKLALPLRPQHKNSVSAFATALQIQRGGGSLSKPNRTPPATASISSYSADIKTPQGGSQEKPRLLQFRGPKARSIMCYLLCGSRVFQQSMRNTLTNVLIYMARDMDISTSTKGTMLTAIATGYFFTQVPGGALADRFGPKNVMTAALFLSAICTILVPTAGELFGLPGMWIVMALMGAVQGPMFPTSSVFLSRWMPAATEPGMPDEKAWGTSMLDMGISLGSLLIIPAVTSLAESLGWKNTFRVVGVASLGFVALWVLLAANTPAECWFISEEELQYLDKHVTKPKVEPKGTSTEETSSNSFIGMPFEMAIHRGLWAIFIAHIAFNFGAYYLTNWSPTYYKDVLGLEPIDAKYHLMMPHITNLLVRVINPMLVTAVAARGFPLVFSRKLFTCVGYVMAGACLAPVYALRSLNPWISTVLFSIANGFFGMAPLGFKSNYLDVTEKYVGIVAGYGNTLGTVASIIGPKLTAATLEKTEQNWYVVLGTVVGVNLLVSINYAMNAVTFPIEKMIAKKGKEKE